MIPKILKISDLSGEFLFTGKIEKNDLNYHALNFAIHESESLEITCNSESAWKLEKFLHPHPFKKVGNIFLLSTTNRSALFNFILRENDCIEKINSEAFTREFKEFLFFNIMTICVKLSFPKFSVGNLYYLRYPITKLGDDNERDICV